MKPPRPIAALIALTAFGAGLGWPTPSGRPEPFQVRTVTMNGMSGPAYYSRAAGAFRFLAPQPVGQVAALDAAHR